MNFMCLKIIGSLLREMSASTRLTRSHAGRRHSAELIRIVTSNLIQLKSNNAKLEKKGVKVLSVLAQMSCIVQFLTADQLPRSW